MLLQLVDKPESVSNLSRVSKETIAFKILALSEWKYYTYYLFGTTPNYGESYKIEHICLQSWPKELVMSSGILHLCSSVVEQTTLLAQEPMYDFGLMRLR